MLFVFGAVAGRVAGPHTLTEAVVDTGNVDAAIAVALALNRALVGAGGFRRQRALVAANRVQARGAGFLEHSEFVAARLAVEAASNLTARDVLQAKVSAFGDAGSRRRRGSRDGKSHGKGSKKVARTSARIV